jgi:hypothetical protein
VPDRGALVEDDAAHCLQLLNHRSWGVAGGFDYPNALVYHDLCVCTVVWWDHGWQKGQVDTEGFVRHALAFPDLLAQVFRCRLRERGELEYVNIFRQMDGTRAWKEVRTIPRPPALLTALASSA